MLHPFGAVLTSIISGDLREARGVWMEYKGTKVFLGMERRTGESADLFVKVRC